MIPRNRYLFGNVARVEGASRYRPRRIGDVDHLQSAPSIGDIGEASIQNDGLGTARRIQGSRRHRMPGIRDVGDEEPGGAIRDEGITIPDHDVLRFSRGLENPGNLGGERIGDIDDL